MQTSLQHKMNSKKRIIVIGTGSIGLRHARVCQSCPDVDLEICESRPEGLAQALKIVGNVLSWKDLDAALASGPDGVIVATPHNSHGPITCAALRAGVHVLCEKPMADTFESALGMYRAQQETGRVLRIGFTLRFHPALMEVKKMIESDLLGEVLHARYTVGSYITLESSRVRHQQSVFGSVAMDFVHGLDILQWLLQKQPSGVYARGVQVGNLELTSKPNVLDAVLDYEESMLANLSLDYIAKPEIHRFEVIGEKGWAKVHFASGTLELGNTSSSTSSSKTLAFERDDLFRAQLRGFLEAIEGRSNSLALPEDGLATASALEAILRSLGSQKREVIQELQSREERPRPTKVGI